MSRSSNVTTARQAPGRGRVAAGIIGALILCTLAYRWWLGGAVVQGGSPETSSNVLMLAIPAFLAGLLSFLSPCTLPILPTYFAWTFQARRERIVPMTVAFFMGLATTMVVLGATASALSQLVFEYRRVLALVGGLVIAAFGFMSLAGRGFDGLVLRRPTASITGSYAYGATFALGWTCCVGPILGALLTMLATQGATVLQGGILAFIYALGLGTPLIIVASSFNAQRRDGRVWQTLRGREWTFQIGRRVVVVHSTNVLSGVLLIATGLMLATGQLTTWSQWALQMPFTTWLLQVEDGIRRLFLGT